MELVARQGNRRLNALPVDFPLMDSQGLSIEKDRRRLPSRRKSEYRPVNSKPIPSTKTRLSTNRLVFMLLIVAINAAFALLVYTLIMPGNN